MRFNSLIDDKKKQRVRDAIARGDTSVFGTKKKPSPDPLSGSRTPGSALEVFLNRANGVSFEEALVRANAAGRIIASNKRLDQALVGSEEWEIIREVFPCWTGTMAAYEESEKPFGRVVEYTDEQTRIRYLFPVPEEYVGVRDGLLVAEHPDFSLETDGNDRIVRAAKVGLIERFPGRSGWCYTDSRYSMPVGDVVYSGDVYNFPDARNLYRIARRVGPVARDYVYLDDDRRYVLLLDYWPSNGLGVAVEAPSGGAPQNPGDKP